VPLPHTVCAQSQYGKVQDPQNVALIDMFELAKDEREDSVSGLCLLSLVCVVVRNLHVAAAFSIVLTVLCTVCAGVATRPDGGQRHPGDLKCCVWKL
jgi:hypothetical protein